VNSFTAILLTVLLLLGNAFFVAAEFALVSARRTQIEPLAEAGNRFARTTLRAMENMSEVIAVNQLGITVCSLVLGAVAEPTIAQLIEPVLHALHVPEAFLHPIAFAIGLSIVVFLHVVMGEMIPKNIALAGPDRAALVLGTPVWAFVTVLRPVIRVINAVARFLLKLVGVQAHSLRAPAGGVTNHHPRPARLARWLCKHRSPDRAGVDQGHNAKAPGDRERRAHRPLQMAKAASTAAPSAQLGTIQAAG